MILELFWQCVFFSFYFIHKSGLTPPLFIEVPVPSQKSERSYICWFGVGLCCLTPLFIEVPVPSHEKWALIHLWVWGWFMLFNTTIYWSACTKPWKVSGHSFVGLGFGLCWLFNTTFYWSACTKPWKWALIHLWVWGWFMLFNVTFNNISTISWRSALLVGKPEKTTNLHYRGRHSHDISVVGFKSHHVGIAQRRHHNPVSAMIYLTNFIICH